MPKTRRGWKRYEQDVAAAVGARRIPVTGRQGPGEDPGDVELPGFYVEVRSRTRARPLRWFAEAWQEARPSGRKPLVIFRGPAPHLSPLVVLRWKDFAEVLRRGGYSPVDRPAAPGPAAEQPAGAGDVAGGRGDVSRLPAPLEAWNPDHRPPDGG